MQRCSHPESSRLACASSLQLKPPSLVCPADCQAAFLRPQCRKLFLVSRATTWPAHTSFFAIKTTLAGLSCRLPNRFSSSAKAFLFLTSPHPHQEQCIIQGHDWDKVGHVYYSQSRLFTIQQCSPRWFTPFPVSLFACNRFDCLVDFVRVGGCHRCCPQVPPRRRQFV